MAEHISPHSIYFSSLTVFNIKITKIKNLAFSHIPLSLNLHPQHAHFKVYIISNF